MKVRTRLVGTLVGGSAVAGVLSVAMLIGGGAATQVSADSGAPTVFISNSTAAPTSNFVTVVQDGSPSVVTVALEGLLPDQTYTVSDCTADPTGATTCVASATPVTTDGSGSVTATVLFDNVQGVGSIEVADTANAGDSYTATVNPQLAGVAVVTFP